jgi:hypothetical protein
MLIAMLRFHYKTQLNKKSINFLIFRFSKVLQILYEIS